MLLFVTMKVSQEGFNYVLQKQEQKKVCFGSGCPRDTSRKGMTPFMKYYTLEDNPNVAPNSYNVLQSFKAITTKPCAHSISKKGYSGIARFTKKTVHKDVYQCPLQYDFSTLTQQVQKSKSPFNSNSKRQTFINNTVPGPGTYNNTGRGDFKFEHSFGGKVKMKLGADLKCCSQNMDICKICNKKPLGDYWHFKNETFLCRPCMNREYYEQLKYKRAELKLFRKVRDCSIMHEHGITTAKMWVLPPNIVTQWTRRESYLSDYLVG